MISPKDEIVSDKMDVLFVGGPEDGKRLTLSALPPTYAVKVRNPDFNALLAKDGNDMKRMMFIDATYRREAFRTAIGLYPVYVHEAIPSQDVMHILLNGYRPLQEISTKH